MIDYTHADEKAYANFSYPHNVLCVSSVRQKCISLIVFLSRSNEINVSSFP